MVGFLIVNPEILNMNFFTELLKGLPAAASSLYGLIAYTVTVLAWAVIAWRVKRNAQLLKHLNSLPETDRFAALQMEMGGIHLKEGVTPDHWLKYQTKRYLMIGYICSVVCLLLVLVIATFKKPSNPDVDLTLYRNEKTNVKDQPGWKIEYATLKKLRPIPIPLMSRRMLLAGFIISRTSLTRLQMTITSPEPWI
jgi:hypothetical protein